MTFFCMVFFLRSAGTYSRICPSRNAAMPSLRGPRRMWLSRSIRMKLMTAHKILIASAAVFFCFFAAWELRNYFASGAFWAMVRAGLYLVVAVGFGVYFKNLDRLYKLK
jgi:hypothetical protein